MRYIALLYSLALVGIDQLIKTFAVDKLSQVTTYPIINGVLHLTYAENTGAAFNSFDKNYLFLIIIPSILLFVGILYLCFYKDISSKFMWCIATVIGGGLGNLCDRVFRKYVVDYIDFRLINFAVFNFADMCIVVGAACVIFYVIFMEYKVSKLQKLQASDEGKDN